MNTILKYKVVRIQKPHTCFGCGRRFEPHCPMVSATVADGTIRSYYLCKSCNKVSFDLGPWPDFGFGDLREAALEYEKEQNIIVKG